MISTKDPFRLNLETVAAASRMLGHRLENRSRIRRAQDLQLLERLQEFSTVPLRTAAQQDAFVVAPLDVLVARHQGRTQFHIIELNGTGIGGISNMPNHVVAAVAESLRRVSRTCWRDDTVLLLPVSGKESDQAPRLNKLMHEKLIFAEAMAAGLADAGGQSDILTLCGLQDGGQSYRSGATAVVIGYIKELLDACEVGPSGAVYLAGRRVVGAVNDRFCLNLLSKYGDRIDLRQFTPINGTYLAGGDKGVVYSLLDEYLVHQPSRAFPSRVHHAHAIDRKSLIEVVTDWLSLGRRVVIKPHGTGIGHGIEFFLDPRESQQAILQRIDRSLAITEEYYAAEGGAFPYTICEFIDAALVDAPRHRLHGRKYELRVVVYRDGLSLRACPTIAKVACRKFDPQDVSRDNLINNITNSAVTRRADGTNFMLPLCNQKTLQLLGILEEELQELCYVATQYVRLAIDEIPRMGQRMRQSLGSDAAQLPEAIKRRMIPFRVK